MRWVFYTLLIINAVFFGWQQFKNDDSTVSASGASQVVDGVEPIRLLSELGEGLSGQLEQRADAEKCDVYGPFFSAIDNRMVLAVVKKAGIRGRQEQEQVNLKPYYWLYVAPLSSARKAQAVINRLRGHQLKADIISDGRLKNGVSLGNFESEDEIERLKQRLEDLDLTLKTREKSRDYRQFWVLLNPGSEVRLKGELQDRLINDFPDIFHQQKVCKPVASG